jgi:hypothetical protein
LGGNAKRIFQSLREVFDVGVILCPELSCSLGRDSLGLIRGFAWSPEYSEWEMARLSRLSRDCLSKVAFGGPAAAAVETVDFRFIQRAAPEIRTPGI